MRSDDIRALLRQQPFRPFRLVLTNNLVYEIRHPEWVAVTRSLVQLNIPSAEGVGATEDRTIGIALLHILQYEIVPRALDVSSN